MGWIGLGDVISERRVSQGNLPGASKFQDGGERTQLTQELPICQSHDGESPVTWRHTPLHVFAFSIEYNHWQMFPDADWLKIIIYLFMFSARVVCI
jgi:hypothetical protein